MKPSRHAAGERGGHMVDHHGHQEWVPDPHPDDRKPPRRKTESMEIVELRRRHDGWTAVRQRVFLNTLANTGRVGLAAEAADITPRSAYRLRNHPQGAAFSHAWDAALMSAANRLTCVAFERAISGTPREIWREGRLVAETSIPSDRMLMFLLRNLNPALFGQYGDMQARDGAIAAMRDAFAPAMAALVDTDVDADLLDVDDYLPHPPPEDIA